MTDVQTESGGDVPPGFLKTKILTTFAEHQLPEILACVETNMQRTDLNFLQMVPQHDETLAIVGGGPSLKDTWPRVKALSEAGAKVFGMNDAPLFLHEKGVKVDGCVTWETHCVPTTCHIAVEPIDTTYYLSSQGHPDWYSLFADHPIVTFHLYPAHGQDKIIGKYDPDPVYIAGGVSAALRSLEIGRALGFRKFHLFGVDGSCEDSTHAYYDSQDGKKFFDAWVGGRRYKTIHYWAQQAIDLCNQVRAYECQKEKHGTPFNLCIHGWGLLPAVAAENGIIVNP